MDSYQTEEEQVESIKKWWTENSRSIFFGVGLGLVAIFGWQNWKEQTLNHTLEASDIYQELTKSLQESKYDEVLQLANEIDESYSDTPYAAMAGLQKAKVQIEQAKKDEAIATLEKVSTTAENKSIQHIARVRSFRVRIGKGQMKEVIADIDAVISEGGGEFVGQYEALKGDAYRLLGDAEKARSGYIAALKTARLDRRLIQLKLDDLGPSPKQFAGEEVTKNNEEQNK
jgi:predicted negative regulator of RcsB-dependent stress response